jgi:hypothetical protein
MNDLRIAIISFEHMHAASYAESFDRVEGASLVAIADSDPERLEMVRGMYPHVPAYYGDYVAMLDHSEVDAVIICSSNRDHLPIALECAARGKHILCEKPLGPTVEASGMLRINGLHLVIHHPAKHIHNMYGVINHRATARLFLLHKPFPGHRAMVRSAAANHLTQFSFLDKAARF